MPVLTRAANSLHYRQYQKLLSMNRASEKPWSILTVVLISIIFTPIVGGIIGGLNEARLGFNRKVWREFLLSFLAFLWYSVYFSIIDHHIVEGTLRIFPLAIFYSARLTPEPFLFFLAIPFVIIICAIGVLQIRSWKELSTNKTELAPWWSAYLVSIFLMLVVGYLLMKVQFLFFYPIYSSAI